MVGENISRSSKSRARLLENRAEASLQASRSWETRISGSLHRPHLPLCLSSAVAENVPFCGQCSHLPRVPWAPLGWGELLESSRGG